MIDNMSYQDPTVIDEVFKNIQKGEFEHADEKLTDNFRSTVMDKEVSKDEYLDTYKCIIEGMPDAKFSLKNMTTDGEIFKAKLSISGTHTKRIPSIHEGVKSIKATGKKVNTYITELKFRLRGEKIIEISNENEKKGIMKSLLRQLDLDPKKYLKK